MKPDGPGGPAVYGFNAWLVPDKLTGVTYGSEKNIRAIGMHSCGAH